MNTLIHICISEYLGEYENISAPTKKDHSWTVLAIGFENFRL